MEEDISELKKKVGEKLDSGLDNTPEPIRVPPKIIQQPTPKLQDPEPVEHHSYSELNNPLQFLKLIQQVLPEIKNIDMNSAIKISQLFLRARQGDYYALKEIKDIYDNFRAGNLRPSIASAEETLSPNINKGLNPEDKKILDEYKEFMALFDKWKKSGSKPGPAKVIKAYLADNREKLLRGEQLLQKQAA